MSRTGVWLATIGLALLATGLALWWLAPALDQHILDLLRLRAGDALVPAATVLSRIGGFAWLGPLVLAVMIWLAWRQRWREALWLLITVGSGRLIVAALKVVFEKARPLEEGWLTVVTSHSFPSSHSAGSLLTAVALAILFRLRSRALLVPALAFGLAVGWSRMALGVHWPSDILAGLGFAMLWAGIASRWHFKTRLPSSQPVSS